MTKEQLQKEFEAVCSNWLDSILWYLQEYKQYMSYEDMASCFSKAFHNMIGDLAKELKELDEED